MRCVAGWRASVVLDKCATVCGRLIRCILSTAEEGDGLRWSRGVGDGEGRGGGRGGSRGETVRRKQETVSVRSVRELAEPTNMYRMLFTHMRKRCLVIADVFTALPAKVCRFLHARLLLHFPCAMHPTACADVRFCRYASALTCAHLVRTTILFPSPCFHPPLPLKRLPLLPRRLLPPSPCSISVCLPLSPLLPLPPKCPPLRMVVSIRSLSTWTAAILFSLFPLADSSSVHSHVAPPAQCIFDAIASVTCSLTQRMKRQA